MKIFNTRHDIQAYLKTLGKQTIGFVPTMGALHNGHLSLISKAASENNVVVCSIFVNPTQFTDAKDLENYPRPIEEDIAKLEAINCDVLFNPGVGDMYDGNEHWHLNIGQLEFLLEGEFRPGHYQGVMQVVYKLLDIVKPTRLYMGQKDYQQVAVINRMIAIKGIPVEMIMCPIERESSGLAMSSRNIHLSDEDKQHALVLSRALQWVKDNFDNSRIADLEEKANDMLQAEPGVQPEYFELTDGQTLLPADASSETIVALTAAKVGKTRLIDNMLIK